MPYLHAAGPRTDQPRGPVTINRGHPLARGLVFAAIPFGGRFLDLVTGQYITGGSTTLQYRKPIDGNGTDALQAALAGTTSTPSGVATGADRVSGPFSVFVEGSLRTNATNAVWLWSYESSNGYGFRFGPDDLNFFTNSIWGRINNGDFNGASNADSLGLNSENFVHRVMMVADGTNTNFYAKGALNRSVASIYTPTAHANRRTIVTSASSSASLMLVFNRALTLNEYRELHANPWQLFDSAPRLYPVAMASADSFSKDMAEAFSLTDISAPASMAYTPLPRPVRRLEQPLGRRVAAAWHATNDNRNWTVNGTVANASRHYNSTEGAHVAFLPSVSLSQVMIDPIGANNTLNFTIFARLRIDSFASNPLFSFGHTGNSLQHYLQCNSIASTLYFVVAGWNGMMNTVAASDETPALTTGKFYNIAIRVRALLIEMWLDGVKVVSTATPLTFAAHTMTHAVIHGVMSSGSPSSSVISASYSALAALPEQLLCDAEIAGITGDPRGIHRMFRQRRGPLLLSASGAEFNKGEAESLTLTDAGVGSHGMLNTRAEAITLTDAQTGPHTAVGAGAESLTLTDAQTGPHTAFGARAESLTLTETSTSSGDGTVGAAEALTLTDAQANSTGYGATRAESITLTDASSMALSAISVLAETLTLTDVGQASTPGDGNISESLTLTDASTKVAVLHVAAAESVTVTDAANALITQLRAAAEALTLSDGSTGNITVVFTRSRTEALSLVDAGAGLLVVVSNGNTETVYVLAEVTLMTVELEASAMIVPIDTNGVSPSGL